MNIVLMMIFFDFSFDLINSTFGIVDPEVVDILDPNDLECVTITNVDWYSFECNDIGPDFSGAKTNKAVSLSNLTVLIGKHLKTNPSKRYSISIYNKPLNSIDVPIFGGFQIYLLEFGNNSLTSFSGFEFSKIDSIEIFKIKKNKLSSIDFLCATNSNSSLWQISLKTLDLTDNRIEFLDPDTFECFTSIKLIALSKNRLRQLNAFQFGRNRFLQTLNLDTNFLDDELSIDNTNRYFSSSGESLLDSLMLYNNNLRRITRKTFAANLSSLRRLYLAYNRIELIEAFSFVTLKKLAFLYLHGNQLKSLDSYTFYGLTSLETLYIKNNYFQQIKPNALNSLKVLKVLVIDFDDDLFFKAKSGDSNYRLTLNSLLHENSFNNTELRAFVFYFKILNYYLAFDLDRPDLNDPIHLDDFLKLRQFMRSFFYDLPHILSKNVNRVIKELNSIRFYQSTAILLAINIESVKFNRVFKLFLDKLSLKSSFNNMLSNEENCMLIIYLLSKHFQFKLSNDLEFKNDLLFKHCKDMEIV